MIVFALAEGIDKKISLLVENIDAINLTIIGFEVSSTSLSEAWMIDPLR